MNANQFVTDRARLSYTHLAQPHANNGGEPKYSVTVLIPKTDVATKQRLDAAYAAALQNGVQSKWNGVMPPLVANPVYDGDGVRPNGERFGAECAGHWVFTASNKSAVACVDASGNPVVNVAADLYSGCYARVGVTFFPYASNGKRGIGAGLECVQKLADGEPLAGGLSAAEAFGAPIPAASPQPQNAGMNNWAPQAAQVQQPRAQQYGGYDPITGQPIAQAPL